MSPYEEGKDIGNSKNNNFVSKGKKLFEGNETKKINQNELDFC